MDGWLAGLAWTHLLFYGTALWVGVGLVGTAVSAMRGERARVRRGARTMAVVVAVYAAVLLGVSVRQPARVVAAGHSRCFEAVCCEVARVEELPGFQARGQGRERLVRVSVLMRNVRRDRSAAEAGLGAYLLDTAGRRWDVVPGLGGVALGTRIAPGGAVVSDPVFRVGREAAGLRLVLRHRGWTVRRLIVGDPESLLHRPEGLLLGPEGAGVAGGGDHGAATAW